MYNTCLKFKEVFYDLKKKILNVMKIWKRLRILLILTSSIELLVVSVDSCIFMIFSVTQLNSFYNYRDSW